VNLTEIPKKDLTALIPKRGAEAAE
jgi:hypothetical protein